MRRIVFAAVVLVLLTGAPQVFAGGSWWNWRHMAPDRHPANRHQHDMVYDAESDRVILFGGWDWGSILYDDTWAYDFNSDTWTQMAPPVHPCARLAAGMAYDAHSDRVILFGGGGPGVYFDDTWAYDYDTDTWEQMAPPSHPSPRGGQRSAYDSGSDRVVLFGGCFWSPEHQYDDTWAYDYEADTWEQMAPPSRPAGRSHGSVAYDAETDLAILFGGCTYGYAMFDDTWAYDYNADAWDDLKPADHPSARYCHGMAYDAESRRVILFGGGFAPGGDVPGICFDDTWAFGASELFCAPHDWLWPYWNWISIPAVPCNPDPNEVLGFDCGGRLWYWDKYGKWHKVYHPPFVTFDLHVGDSYLLWLDQVPEPVWYVGNLPETPFEFKLGRMGWTWIGMPGLEELRGWEFMCSVKVKYPSDETGEVRAAWEDWLAWDSWLCWGWSWWDGLRQCPRTFTPYLPWHNTCYPWRGYRVWVRTGNALSEHSPDQVTLIWP